ncbi:FCD domain-containing protein [Pontixanthobacter gangjinensis]|uniref:GntR family transcriptional regulator n=1 Tax=Pontixanthobacter gangjinensis TaxID=1028742 RepID=A0A6I4SRM6_9SPHN|nr:GntR family transcriptional regulator [Pontixanthobacter gangjinensis]MXO57780.1 GntR family transcriptional regulator [Pontixanthobacter gangjinensis]
MNELGQSELGEGTASDGPFRVPKTAELVANSIRRRIIQGDLCEGDTLPPEAQLMEQFGISRPSLREAFRILEAERLITVKRGSRSGARVSLPKVESVSRYASYYLQSSGVKVSDIYEARLALEPHVVRKLASEPSAVAVDRLRAEASRLAGFYESDQERDYMMASARFHSVLMEVGGNATLHFLTRVLEDVIAQYQKRYVTTASEAADRKRGREKGVKSISKLIDLIEAADPDAAEQHWLLHLTNTNKIWGSDRTLGEVLAG